MLNFKKMAILLIMLVLPVVIFAFLKIFGRNEFSGPPVMVPDNLTACVSVAPGKHQVPSFQLLSADSLPLTDEAFAGKVYVAAFFSTDCNDVCADITSGMYRVQERFAKDERVALISHTVKPDTDTPALLKQYGQRFDAQAGKWHFATGDAKALKEIATCGYAIQAQSPALAHEPMLAMIDHQKRIRGYYDATKREEVNRMLDEIALVLREVGK